MAPLARVSVGCGELGSAKPLGARMSRQMSTSTCVTAPNWARPDMSEDLLGGVVEHVVVVLDEVAAGLLSAPHQHLQLLEGRSGRLLHDDVGAGVQRIHGQPEVGGRGCGDVDHVGPGLLQHWPGGR
jgi:hypothetical protein